MKNSIASLLRAIQNDRGFILEVENIIKTSKSEVVFIKMNCPLRTVKITKETFSKIEPFLLKRRPRRWL